MLCDRMGRISGDAGNNDAETLRSSDVDAVIAGGPQCHQLDAQCLQAFQHGLVEAAIDEWAYRFEARCQLYRGSGEAHFEELELVASLLIRECKRRLIVTVRVEYGNFHLTGTSAILIRPNTYPALSVDRPRPRGVLSLPIYASSAVSDSEAV